MAKRDSKGDPKAPSNEPLQDAAPDLLIQLEACRKLLELARSGFATKAYEIGIRGGNKILRALDDIYAAEQGIIEATHTVRRLTAPSFPVSKVLAMAGLSSDSNAV